MILVEHNLFGCKETETCMVTIKSYHGKYISAEENGNANAKKDQPEIWTVTFVNQNKVNFKSAFNKYLVAEPNGDANANRDVATEFTEFTAIDRGNGLFNFKSYHGKYLVAVHSGGLYANRADPDTWELFKVEKIM